MSSKKINEMIIKSVVLERAGWTVKWKQVCDHCNTPNHFPKYNAQVVCGRCGKEYVMDAPQLIQQTS